MNGRVVVWPCLLARCEDLTCPPVSGLQVMPPKRLPGSPTVKKKGPPGPGQLIPFCLSSPLSLCPAAPNPAIPPGPVGSRSRLWPLSAAVSPSLPANTPSSGPWPSPSPLFITRWLRARPHGYRRSCPRDRCSGQPTTGKKWLIYWLLLLTLAPEFRSTYGHGH